MALGAFGSSKLSSGGSSSFLSGSSCDLPSVVSVNWVRLSYPLGVPTAYSGTAALVTVGLFAGLAYIWTGSGQIISLYWNGNRWDAYSGGPEVLAISGPDYCDPRGAYTPVFGDVLSLGVF